MYKIDRKMHNQTNVTSSFTRYLIVHWSY